MSNARAALARPPGPVTVASSVAMEPGPGTRKRRADAERNISRIVEAAVSCFSRHPEASMADIAEAAGVGRVTLYAHFASREALLEAATGRAMVVAMAALDQAAIDDGPPPEALARMIRHGWPAFGQVWSLHAALGRRAPDWIGEHVGGFLARIAHLVDRGQADGSFRSDLPRDWLVAAFHGIVQAAGEEVAVGRLDHAIAADVLEATLLGVLSPGGREVVGPSGLRHQGSQ